MAKESKKRITILGSTGSIGTQALDVIQRNAGRFRISALTCGKNVERLMDQVQGLPQDERPGLLVCESEKDMARFSSAFPGIRTAFGPEGLIEAAEHDSDVVLNALMGMRGMVPTYHAIKSGKDVALANKETLVAGGHIIMRAAREKSVRILPVDSEHNAIFQCLERSGGAKIKKILLTCSGGPFRGWSREDLSEVTPEMALKHPNWSMGKKITIDSATMMNKGLEIIEAKWLFGVDIDDIEVLIHPGSIVHSAVEFMDNSIIAEMGAADMRVPISVALGYPERLDNDFGELDIFEKASELKFERPDNETFRCMDIAREASKEGGTYPVCMNAANEVLVQLFLDKKIGFLDIEKGIREAMDKHEAISDPSLDDVLLKDRETRESILSELG